MRDSRSTGLNEVRLDGGCGTHERVDGMTGVGVAGQDGRQCGDDLAPIAYRGGDSRGYALDRAGSDDVAVTADPSEQAPQPVGIGRRLCGHCTQRQGQYSFAHERIRVGEKHEA